MDDAFDPYHKWLGTPPDEQPPNHYRLLGVAALEADLDVISHASDQRMAHIRTFQGGKHAHFRSVCSTRSPRPKCACSRRHFKKQQYDQMLLEQRAAPARSLMPPSPPPNMPPVGHAPARPIARRAAASCRPGRAHARAVRGRLDSKLQPRPHPTGKTSWLAPIVFMLFVIAGLGLAVAIVVHNQKAVAPVPAEKQRR